MNINTRNKISYAFNLGLITPLDTSLPNGFSIVFKFSLIFMNIQMRIQSFLSFH